MVHILDIPENIQATFLTKSLSDDINSTYQRWKASLQILAVCSLWRTICKPIVYKTAFVECIQESISPVSLIDFDLSQVQFTKVMTNLYLISSIEALDVPTCFKIASKTNKDLAKMLELCSDIIMCSNARLPNVREMAIQLYVYRYTACPSTYTLGEQRRIASTAIDIMMQTCPNIENIDSNGSQGSVIVDYVTNMFASKCSNRLLKIHSHTIMPTMDLRCCSSITSLDVYVSSIVLPYLPTLPVEQLKYLSLSINIPCFPWDLLIKDDQSGVINFPWLVNLHVRYYQADANIYLRSRNKLKLVQNDPSIAKIQCPRLELLDMVCCSHDNVLQSSIQSCNSVKTMLVQDTIAGLLLLRPIDHPSLQRIYICTEYPFSNTSLDYDSIPVLNNFLQNSHLPPKVSLHFNIAHALDCLEDIRWDAVTNLKVSTFSKPETIIRVLGHLPNLTVCHIYVTNTDENIYTRLTTEQPAGHYVLSASITRLRLETQSFKHDTSQFKLDFEFAKYLLVSLPSLVWLSWSNIKFDWLLAFAEQNQQQYPHLRKLKIAS